MSRICTVYKCPKHSGRPCCSDCKEKGCEDRCKNSPERCHVWQDSRPHRISGFGREPIYDKKKIVELYEEGYARIEIVEMLGCSKGTVASALIAAGYKGKKGRLEDT